MADKTEGALTSATNALVEILETSLSFKDGSPSERLATAKAMKFVMKNRAELLSGLRHPSSAQNKQLLETCIALETLFAPLAKDSTQAMWIERARKAISLARIPANENDDD